MQELGVWVTTTGTSEAYLEVEFNGDSVSATELPAWASGAIQGALTGAATGAAAGPWGAVIGAAAGGALGAASSAAAPAPVSAASTTPVAPSMPAGAATQPTDPNRTRAIQALQQFVAVAPLLVQLIAASAPVGKPYKKSELGEIGEGSESMDDWAPESFVGTWTLP